MLFSLVGNGVPLINLFSVFIFLPLSLLIYYLLPTKYREAALLTFSLLFFIIVAPEQLWLIVLLVALNYIIAHELLKTLQKGVRYSKLLLSIGFIINAGFWVCFGIVKTTGDFPYILGGTVIPFLLFSTLVNIYNEKTTELPDFFRFLLFSIFFPRLFVGPFNTIEEFYSNTFTDTDVKKSLTNGFGKFVTGSVQFLFLGERLVSLSNTLAGFDSADKTLLSSIMLIVTLALGIYHSLAGLLTAAEGVSNMYGIALPSGWGYPLSEKTLMGFSRKFHGSLENLLWRLFPVWHRIGSFSKVVQVFYAATIGAVVGLWVDFSLHFMLGGILVAAFVVVEYFFLRKAFSKLPTWVSKLYMMTTLVFSFVIVTFGYTGWNNEFIKNFFSFEVPFSNKQGEYYFGSYSVLILIAALCSTNIILWFKKLKPSFLPRARQFLKGTVILALFIILITLII